MKCFFIVFIFVIAIMNIFLASIDGGSVSSNELYVDDVEFVAEGETDIIPPQWLLTALPFIEAAAGVATVVTVAYVIYDHCTSDDDVELGVLKRYFHKKIPNSNRSEYIYDCKGTGNYCNLRTFTPYSAIE